MCKKLTEETKQLLDQYFDAAVNLYGIIPLRKLLEIYNSQNEPIDEKSFLEFVDEIDLDHKNYFIVGEDEFFEDIENTDPIDRDVVAEHLLMYEDDDAYIKTKIGQRGKPYYIPNKKQFLKYTNSFYLEKTLSFISLRAFFRNQPGLTKEEADAIAWDIYGMADVFEGSITDTVDFIEEYHRFHFTESTFKKFYPLYVDMFNNTRLIINRGHTPSELQQRSMRGHF